ncbi:hypothetical protein BH10PSE11_BH10PSE11_34070 [soil metagenome]
MTHSKCSPLREYGFLLEPDIGPAKPDLLAGTNREMFCVKVDARPPAHFAPPLAVKTEAK